MARLPVTNSDDGTWGGILNDYLLTAHNADGTLKAGVVSESNLDAAAQAKLNTVGSGGGSGVASVNTRTGAVTLTKTDVGLANVDNTSDASKPISTATQTALNAKAAAAHTHTSGQITDATATGTSLITAADAAAARTAIGAGTSNLTLGSTSTTAKAGNYAPTKADVGLGNVDNTSDASKPVSTATQTALDGKAATVHTHTASQISDSTVTGRSLLMATDAAAARSAIGAGTSNLALGTTSSTAKAGDYAPTKADVGLGNVDNTSDATKNSATATLTNKFISGINNTFTYIPQSGVSGLEADLAAKAVDSGVVHLAGLENITGAKTFATNPKMSGIQDVNNVNMIGFVAVTSAVNYLTVQNAITTGPPTISAVGSDTNIDISMMPKGFGRLKISNVNALTVSSNDTVTNKTMSGASNTFSSIPQSAVTNLTTDLAAKADASALGTKLLLIDNAAALPAGTPAGVVVVVKA